jgi:uncharacterized integral membrane protein (TIGR00698 family)
MLARLLPAKIWPGLALVAALTLLAALLGGVAGIKPLAGLPGVKILGPLGLALLLGIATRALWGLPAWAKPGSSYAAKTLLRLGIVLLGVRLNFAKALAAGPLVLLLDGAMVTLGIVLVERLGKWLGLSRGLRLALAFGTGICGASAAVAAGSVVGAKDEEVSLAVGTVSLLGTVGVLGYIAAGQALGLAASPTGQEHYGLLTGATLQEVGQVVAASSALGPVAADLATLVKLTRVAMLAPALLLAQAILRLRDARNRFTGSEDELLEASGPQNVFPVFLLGFLATGVLASSGFLPKSLLDVMQPASVLLTTAAMVGIGLSVDLRAIGRVGAKTIGIGAIGFVVMVLVALGITWLG